MQLRIVSEDKSLSLVPMNKKDVDLLEKTFGITSDEQIIFERVPIRDAKKLDPVKFYMRGRVEKRVEPCAEVPVQVKLKKKASK